MESQNYVRNVRGQDGEEGGYIKRDVVKKLRLSKKQKELAMSVVDLLLVEDTDIQSRVIKEKQGWSRQQFKNRRLVVSLYCIVQTQFKNEEALICALVETGKWKREHIERHTQAQNLFGYKGDMRRDKANIIIRRAQIGGASNDIGFIKNKDNVFEMIVSQFDKGKYNNKWVSLLKSNYAFNVIKIDQEKRGRTVSRQRTEDGRQRITINGYR